MDLFDLFVKIGVDDQASDHVSNLASKLGDGLKTAAKIGTAAVTAAAAGITALTTAAVNNYAEYEQLVGGVETLFKDAAVSVEGYAEVAYKTAGLSANQYMETVTSFAASLIQSLDGDTLAAAQKAQMAVTDMADNANKMGTSMEMIQNAYQGFAKQNYTMLDNLKLGYGGTQEEMYRLMQDAEALGAVFNGEYYLTDKGRLIADYADIVEAIHVVQTEMGITGTTALEAEKTIIGSTAMVKASWSDLLTGIADENADMDRLINNFVDSVAIAGENLLPRIEVALDGAGQLIDKLLPIVLDKIPETITKYLPKLTDGAVNMVQTLVSGLMDDENQAKMADAGKETLSTLVGGISSLLPDLLELGSDLIIFLVDGIAENSDSIVDTAFEIINRIVETLLNPQAIGSLIDSTVTIVLSISNGLVENLPILLTAVFDIIIYLAEKLTDPDTLVSLVDAALEIIIALATGLLDAIPELVRAIPIIIGNLIEAILLAIPEIGKAGFDIVLALISGSTSGEANAALLDGVAKMIEAIVRGLIGYFQKFYDIGRDIFIEIKDGFLKLKNDPKTWGKDLIDNFIGGIKEKWNNLKNTVKDVAQSIKDLLGFSEPKEGPLSNFHTYAPDMMHLFAQGIRENEHVITDQIEKSFDFGERTISAAYDISASGGAAKSGVTVIQNIYSQAQTAADLMQEAQWEAERAVLFGV